MAFEDVVPTVAAAKKGMQPACAVCVDPLRQQVRAQSEVRVHVDQAQVLPADPGDLDALLDGRVGLAGGVGREPLPAAACVAGQPRCPFPGGQQRAQGGAGGGIFDHAAAATRGTEVLRQLQHLRHPVEHVGFELGAGGARGPQHALHAEPGGDQIAQNGGSGGVGRKVCKKIRGLPVRDARQNPLAHIPQHDVEGLALPRRVGRQAGADVARFDRGEHRQRFHALVIVGHPVDGGVPETPELGRAHVAGFLFGHSGVPRKGVSGGCDRRSRGRRPGGPGCAPQR